MSLFNDILNAEIGSSVRAKLNAIIAWINSIKTDVTENEDGNSSFGNGAGASLEDGIDNTAYGANTLNLNESGGECTAIGKDSLISSPFSDRNTSIGALCMSSLVNGGYGTAVGYLSQGFAKFVWRNVSLGYKSMRGNEVGHDNIAIGYKALQDMNSTNKAISSYTDLGGGQVECLSVAHGRSESETINIVGTGPWVDHAWEGNYDGQYIITNVTTDTFEITAAYVNPSELYSLGRWYKINEAVGNVAIGQSSGITHGKGSFNLLLGYQASASDPDGDSQLNIGNVITGRMAGEKNIEVDGSLTLAPKGAPTSPTEGETYFDSSDKHFYGYNGTAWKQLDN